MKACQQLVSFFYVPSRTALHCEGSYGQTAETLQAGHLHIANTSMKARQSDAQSARHTQHFTVEEPRCRWGSVLFSQQPGRRRRSELAFSSHSERTQKTQVLVFC